MDVRTRIRNYFAQVVAEPVSDEEDIFARGIVDSMFGMQLVAFVEDVFSIIVEKSDLDIRHFSSIAALTAFVEAKLRLVHPEPGDGSPAH
jgi:methoxymalonate biosynthesis acyl carrier protein